MNLTIFSNVKERQNINSFMMNFSSNRMFQKTKLVTTIKTGAKGDWDFWISDLVKHPDGTDI